MHAWHGAPLVLAGNTRCLSSTHALYQSLKPSCYSRLQGAPLVLYYTLTLQSHPLLLSGDKQQGGAKPREQMSPLAHTCSLTRASVCSAASVALSGTCQSPPAHLAQLSQAPGAPLVHSLGNSLPKHLWCPARPTEHLFSHLVLANCYQALLVLWPVRPSTCAIWSRQFVAQHL